MKRRRRRDIQIQFFIGTLGVYVRRELRNFLKDLMQKRRSSQGSCRSAGWSSLLLVEEAATPSGRLYLSLRH